MRPNILEQVKLSIGDSAPGVEELLKEAIRIEVALGSKAHAQPSTPSSDSGAKGGQGKSRGDQKENKNRMCRSCGQGFTGQWKDHAPNCPELKPKTQSQIPTATVTPPKPNISTGGNGKSFSGNCYNCGQPGHTKDKCPKAKAVRTVESSTDIEQDTTNEENDGHSFRASIYKSN